MNGRRVNSLGDLAQSVPPPRDLWPAISAAIEADKVAAAPVARRYGGWPVSAIAASVLLVAVGVLIGRQFGSVTVSPVAGNPAQTDGMMPAALRDANYRKQRDELLVQVQAKLNTMAPAERAKIAGSLETLKRSIGEIETALGHDPANALLQELLVNSCQEEMRALTAVRDSGNQET